MTSTRHIYELVAAVVHLASPKKQDRGKVLALVLFCTIMVSREEVREIKVTICEIAGLEETEIVIKCAEMNAEIERLAAALRGAEEKIIGTKNGKTYILEPTQILYFDTVDSRTFIYTTENVFETSKRLYEIEERLAGGIFLEAQREQL